MLDFPLIFGLPHDLRILDLDDPAQFVRVGLRPTQIVTRNLAVMQGRTHRIWSEKAPHRSDHTWQAVSWWSFRRLQRPVLGSLLRPELVRVEPLDMDNPAISDSAKSLNRVVK
ncbi:hypothetical protein [Rhodococcus qingshengii]|uniref:hypothetical protein n=1 Tax=Rhodococcus qingshengii TaxID=334542 RepID=UPI0035E23879